MPKDAVLVRSHSMPLLDPGLHSPKHDFGRERSGSLDGQKLSRSSSNPLQFFKRIFGGGDGARLSDHNVQQLNRPGQFGLKFFQNGGGAIQRFGERYDRSVHGDRQVGPYRVVGDKSRGVEPGFIGRKAWTAGDTAKMTTPGHKFSVKADNWLRQNLNQLGGNFQVQKAARDILVGMGDTGFRPGKHDVYRFLAARPDLQRTVFAMLKQDPAIDARLREHIMSTEPKFTKNHYVKLDYRETERSGDGDQRTYTLPKSNAKSFGFGAIGKFFHQLARRQSPDQINRDAMRESLANDLMKSFGIFAQKLKLVPTTYQDGTSKLLLDGTHMTGPNGEKFSDFEGSIKGKSPYGQLVRMQPDGKEPFVNTRGHYEVDTSINEMGRNKIFMLLLGDRDAIGSSGGNKGRVGNTFAAIDPGHSLELGGQRLMERRDINSDMSFDQPSRLAGKCYKNFTIFDQCSFSERMEGVRKLQELVNSGEDLQVFDDYAAQFNHGRQGLDFEDQINAMRDAYVGRRDYILEVFEERLGVYDFDMAGVGDANAQETAKKQTLDILDTFEKITAKRSWMSGNTELQHPTIKDRTEWHVAENGDDVEFSVEGLSRSGRRGLEEFLEHHGLTNTYPIVENNGRLAISIPKDELGTAFGHINIRQVEAFDTGRVQAMIDVLDNAGLG